MSRGRGTVVGMYYIRDEFTSKEYKLKTVTENSVTERVYNNKNTA